MDQSSVWELPLEHSLLVKAHSQCSPEQHWTQLASARHPAVVHSAQLDPALAALWVASAFAEPGSAAQASPAHSKMDVLHGGLPA
jgi:hypothetical protein